MILVVVCAAGAALFLWPFVGLGVPASTPALAVALGLCLGLCAVETGMRRLDSRLLALLATIAAIDAALRLALVVGIAGFSPIFFLVLCAGYVLGPRYGFLAGATSLLLSAVVTGGLGPWVPYELFGVGWTGMAAGFVGRRARGAMPGRGDVVRLAIAGTALGLLYGALLDVWDWTAYRGDPGIGWLPRMPPAEALRHFWRFYLTTSFAYDSFRAIGNLLTIAALGGPILLALRRFQRRFSVELVDAVEPAVPPSMA